jgi:hypothetical protein
MNAETNLILVRGVSGAGKSTIGELFDDDRTKIFSTDDMFYVDGEYIGQSKAMYIFKSSRLNEYHAATIVKVKNLMIEYNYQVLDCDYVWFPINRIVVCNTFTCEWEMKPYFDLAKEYEWRVHTIIVENRHDSDSIHNVPTETIKEQKERFEVYL